MTRHKLVHVILGFAAAFALASTPAGAGKPRGGHEKAGHQTFASPQANPMALSPNGQLLLVASTTSSLVDVIDTGTNTVTKQIQVGMEPVAIAFKPDGTEAWVANHVSDSVSVIDTDSASASFLEVIETIQDLSGGVTSFDEPVGVAFASDTKAYVALSSSNQIAIIDPATYAVSGAPLAITAQEPRAISVANGRLYVAAFESFNQTQLSLCDDLLGNGIIGDPCSLGLIDIVNFAVNTPALPTGVKNIIVNSSLPDRDLFVFNTSNDNLIKTVSGVSTLLYGVAVDSADRVYVTSADARNAENGDHDELLDALDNEMFDNEVVVLDCGVGGQSCSTATTVDLDPNPVDRALALSTPYGVAVSGDDSTVLATASGTHRIFSMTSGGTILDRLDVGSIPKGIVLTSDGGGAPDTAYVLNTLDNTVTVVDASTPSSLSVVTTIPVGDDPTPDDVRRGNIAFNDALASDSGNFSCGSCHPDSHTDQLLWRIGAACPSLGCGNGDEPRSTMPIRGLRDTEPLHWGGELGDAFGGGDGSVGASPGAGGICDPTVLDGSKDTSGGGPPNGDCARQLVDASLSGVMCDQSPSCANGPTGDPGRLTDQERRDIAIFLRSVTYPPARERPIDDDVTATAEQGFKDFFMDQSSSGSPNTCADTSAGCHELPLGTATNSETLGAFDAPTMRGLMDRYLQFSLAPTLVEDMLNLANAGINQFGIVADPLEPEFEWDPSIGLREETTFGVPFLIFQGVYGVRPGNMIQMVEEASNGHSGALGRQVTLNDRTTNGGLAAGTDALLTDLENADAAGVVNLRGRGLRFGNPATLSYKNSGSYKVGGATLTHAQLVAEAQAGTLNATLTGHLRSGISESTPQPLIAPRASNCGTGVGLTGDPALPSGSVLAIESKYVTTNHVVIVDGVVDASASIVIDDNTTSCEASGDDSIAEDDITITLGSAPSAGMHLLQVLTSKGLLSNEMPFCAPSGVDCR